MARPQIRKIIQIATALPGEHDSRAKNASVYALCDDGTLWVKTPHAEIEQFSQWRLVEGVPQDSGWDD